MKLRFNIEEWHETKLAGRADVFQGRIVTHVTNSYQVKTEYHTPIDFNETQRILEECNVHLADVTSITLTR